MTLRWASLEVFFFCKNCGEGVLCMSGQVGAAPPPPPPPQPKAAAKASCYLSSCNHSITPHADFQAAVYESQKKRAKTYDVSNCLLCVRRELSSMGVSLRVSLGERRPYLLAVGARAPPNLKKVKIDDDISVLCCGCRGLRVMESWVNLFRIPL